MVDYAKVSKDIDEFLEQFSKEDLEEWVEENRLKELKESCGELYYIPIFTNDKES